jgi:predicted phosphodiesterase
MHFALISCIHANLPALEAVLQDARQMQCERMLCLGDIVGYHDHPKECLDLIRTNCQACVKGNHDDCASTSDPLTGFNPNAAENIKWTRSQLSEADRSWLRALPYHLDIEDFTIVHASLNAPEKWGYVFDKLAAAGHFERQSMPLCFYGHTHVPVAFMSDGGKVTGGTFSTFAIKPGTKYFINVGSVGQSRDGHQGASYVVYDSTPQTVQLRRVDYPRPPSGGVGVREPAPGRGGPPRTLRAKNDFPDS